MKPAPKKSHGSTSGVARSPAIAWPISPILNALAEDRRRFHVADAKPDLTAGETLDGEDGLTVCGKPLPAHTSLERGALPIGLAHGIALKRAVRAAEIVGWHDVEIEPDLDAEKARREMERRFGTERGFGARRPAAAAAV